MSDRRGGRTKEMIWQHCAPTCVRSYSLPFDSEPYLGGTALAPLGALSYTRRYKLFRIRFRRFLSGPELHTLRWNFRLLARLNYFLRKRPDLILLLTPDPSSIPDSENFQFRYERSNQEATRCSIQLCWFGGRTQERRHPLQPSRDHVIEKLLSPTGTHKPQTNSSGPGCTWSAFIRRRS